MEKINVYVLGPNGSYSHQAAKVIAERDGLHFDQIIFTESNYKSLRCLEAAASQGDFAVVPVENTSAGLVEDTRRFYLEMLAERRRNGGVVGLPVSVIGEVILPIRHCLAGLRVDPFGRKIKRVFSHPQALAQCQRLIAELGVETVSCTSTAAAAEAIAHPDDVAICSPFAASLNDLEIINGDVQDHAGNETRFHLLGKQSRQSMSTNFRTALMLSLRDQPRSLLNVLWSIGANEVNISSLHSIPMGERGVYSFYLELDCNIESMVGMEIIARLDTVVDEMVVLGTYPRERGGVA